MRETARSSGHHWSVAGTPKAPCEAPMGHVPRKHSWKAEVSRLPGALSCLPGVVWQHTWSSPGPPGVSCLPLSGSLHTRASTSSCVKSR